MSTLSISKKAFWDVSFEKIDFEKSSLFVMQKVFNSGDWDDKVKVMKYYGHDRIRREIINASYLRKPVLSFLCVVLGLDQNDFSFHIRMQTNPLPWPY